MSTARAISNLKSTHLVSVRTKLSCGSLRIHRGGAAETRWEPPALAGGRSAFAPFASRWFVSGSAPEKAAPIGSGLMIQPGEMKTRFSAGHQQRRFRRDWYFRSRLTACVMTRMFRLAYSSSSPKPQRKGDPLPFLISLQIILGFALLDYCIFSATLRGNSSAASCISLSVNKAPSSLIFRSHFGL
jgi:hypothetical protein